jgi:hypothetical protein
MKVFYVIMLVALLSSCLDGKTTTTKRSGEKDPTQRIVGKGYIEYEGVGYQIVEIDGTEYISSTSGGICRLEK